MICSLALSSLSCFLSLSLSPPVSVSPSLFSVFLSLCISPSLLPSSFLYLYLSRPFSYILTLPESQPAVPGLGQVRGLC